MEKSNSKKVQKPKGLFVQLPVLSKKDCLRAKNTVLELKSEWEVVKRIGPLNNRRFYRLGSSLEYSTIDQRIYLGRAKLMNPLMKEKFDWLYKKVAKFLSQHLGKPVRLRNDISFPGFHIVMNDPVFGKYSAPWHFDSGTLHIKWKHQVKMADVKAFTIPISLPSGGGTLDIKNLTFNDVFAEADKRKKVRGAKILGRFPHKLGHVFIINSHQYHRIGMLRPPFDKKEMRITLQGYLIPQKDHWIIHW